MRLEVISLVLLALVSHSAEADLVIDITGTPGSSIVTVSLSGTGTWSADSGLSSSINAFAWDGDWADATLDVGGGFSFGLTAPALTGSLTVDTGTGTVDISNLIVAHSSTGDRVFFFATSGFDSFSGDPYSFGGTATFDLAALGSPDLGPTATFDGLTLGTFTATANGDHVFGTTVLTISSAVPEPTSLALVASAAGAIGMRGRRRAAR